MDPTTSFVLAVVAIVVSGLSVIASFWALAQSNQLHPKPFFTAKVGRQDFEDSRPVAHFTITNIGHASGHDLNLLWRNRTTGSFERVWQGGLIELGTSHPMVTKISLVSGSTRNDHDEYGADLYPSGEPVNWVGDFELNWRQDPDLKRQRHLYWTLTCEDTNLFARPTYRNRFLRHLAESGARGVARPAARDDRHG